MAAKDAAPAMSSWPGFSCQPCPPFGLRVVGSDVIGGTQRSIQVQVQVQMQVQVQAQTAQEQVREVNVPPTPATCYLADEDHSPNPSHSDSRSHDRQLASPRLTELGLVLGRGVLELLVCASLIAARQRTLFPPRRTRTRTRIRSRSLGVLCHRFT
jgi:hypothetical protein